MFKLITDICVGILLCTAQDQHIDTTKNYITPETYNECKVTMYTEDGYNVVKPFNGSLQESLVVKQCDTFTSVND